MSTVATATPVTLDRYELPGNLASLAALASSGQVTIRPHELIRTTDGRVYHWTTSALEIVSAPVHHGTVADVAALAGVYLLPSCTRGVHAGDTAFVTAAGCEYRVTSGINATAVWAACASIPTSASAIGADPSGTAADAVSTHNTATDSHADIRADLAGKQDALSISTVGASLLALATPTAAKIPRINTAGTVTLIDVPSGGGGDGGVTVPDPIREYALTADFSDSMGGSALTPTNAVISSGWAVLTAGYMQIPDGTDLDCAEWSIAVDVAPASVSNWMRIWDIGDGVNSFVILAVRSSDGVVYLGSKMAGVDIYASTASLRPSSASPNYWPVNSPSTYVVTYSAEIGAKLYVDGRWVLSVPTCLGLATVGHAVAFFGRSKISGEPAFTGRMRNARIWDVCLSPAHVLSVSM